MMACLIYSVHEGFNKLLSKAGEMCIRRESMDIYNIAYTQYEVGSLTDFT